MPSWSEKQKTEIFDSTDGICYLCGKQLVRSNHGKRGRRGAWEVEHMRPRAGGGSNNLKRNLLPACINCNAEKGTMSTKEWFGL